MTDGNTLHIPEFALGWLYAESHRTYVEILKTVETDYWEAFQDVPLDASPHREYKDYDLQFFIDEDDSKWHCIAYEIWHDEGGRAYTKLDGERRLW